jgi:hypothetical protein
VVLDGGLGGGLRLHRQDLLQDVRIHLIDEPRELHELLRSDAGDVLERDAPEEGTCRSPDAIAASASDG